MPQPNGRAHHGSPPYHSEEDRYADFNGNNRRKDEEAPPLPKKHHPESDDQGPDENVTYKLSDFADKTTAHGWKRILIAHNTFSRAFWLLTLSILACMLGYQICVLTKKYQSHEKITSVEVKRES